MMRDAVFVTQNSGDFKLLHEAWLLWSRHWALNKVHPGAIVLRPNVPVTESIEDMRSVLQSFAAFGNKLILFDRAKHTWSYWPAES